MSRRIVVGLFVFLLVAALPAWAGYVTGVRIQENPDHVRLILDLSRPVEHKVFTMSQPDRVVVDLEQIRLKADLAALKRGDSGILNIRSGQQGSDGLRVVFDLKDKVTPRSFVLGPEGKAGHRLVIDLFPAAGHAMAKRTVEKIEAPAALRDIVVMIDPGHGGQDPGAIGPGGVREKDVVMNISRQIADLLNAREGYTVRMTRSDDRFIPLRKRTELARQHNADLLISVHADAYSNPAASGASVYALSKTGATSEAAKWLADRENKSDLIGGLGGGVNLEDKDEVLAGVLLDLSMTASMNASVDVGARILGALRNVNRLHKRRVEKAGFVVLKSPDIPSILVETGFISNPDEALKLGDTGHQRKLANAVAAGVTEYFSVTPPPGTLIAARQNAGKALMTYKASRGDTLSSIALRNNISVMELMKANGLTRETLQVGQVLVIPTS